jgi:hypothetical protein
MAVVDIFRRHGPAYVHAHDCHLGRRESRVMSAIKLCRTAALDWLEARAGDLLPVPNFHVGLHAARQYCTHSLPEQEGRLHHPGPDKVPNAHQDAGPTLMQL